MTSPQPQMRYTPTQLTDKQLRRVRQMREAGETWAAIAREMRMNVETLRRHLDPDFAERSRANGRARRERAKRREAGHSTPVSRGAYEKGPSAEDVRALLSRIPRDTRGLTARIMGDPLPGRSALDRLRSKLAVGEERFNLGGSDEYKQTVAAGRNLLAESPAATPSNPC